MTKPSALRWTMIPCAVLALAAVAAGCSGVPSGVIPPDDMAELMADIHIGESVVEQNRPSFKSDSARLALKQTIYARHGYTPAQVDESMMWYGRNIDKYCDVYERVEKILDQQIAEANEVAAASVETAPMMAFEADGDSVDVWPLYRTRQFNPNFVTDRLPFYLKNDRYWERGDIYHLRFRSVDTPEPVEVSLAAEYTDGGVDYTSATVKGDGWHDLYLRLDPESNGSAIYGAIAYPVDPEGYLPGTVADPRIDSVSLVRMRASYADRLPRKEQRRFKRPAR